MADEKVVTYPLPVIAKLLLLTERRVTQLAAQGVIPRAERGRYELAPAVQGYIRYLKERALGGDLGGDESLAALKGKLIRQRTRVAEVEASLLEGQVLRRPDVEAAWEQILGNLRTALLALPSRTAPLVHAARSLPEANEALTEAVHDLLEQLATVPVYAVAEPERPAGADRGDEEEPADAGASAEVDDFAMG